MADFANFVKDAREKKKNESLAQEFLGRGRKAQASGAGLGRSQRETSEKPTLLSRISGAGVQKQRSSSAKPAGAAANIDGKWQHDLHKLNNPNGPPGKRPNRTTTAQIDRNSRTYDKFASVLNNNASARNNDAPGFSIRGVANGGPYTVIASNFAPGTTAADIEAVMMPVGGETLGCRLISAAPTVMVELQFVDKQGAENVIATFNNQKADGRLLYVYMKETPASNAMAHSRPRPARPAQTFDDMEVDTNGAAARNGSFQDGRFGFSEGSQRDPPRGPRRRY
ncbi:hypothetical protein P153DRAFT_353650 [Dothidotthia symphoricarpi CBS 119687]|uniref:RRM domain-containing protein n=1 Tax=Dothidotthia symphoricarpi CBS 119687 TaxID=1392245 RepID=A0A6A6APX5_9PLEO|nr:uncharacterized protein P153DRAFT_353650 [Dothidotthia symphoricarpi CBS 119687]KAF2133253.1 hypothetical protein P153DRAFT_353650 [Dothidotthia symphoricarpi CBS 119687]